MIAKLAILAVTDVKGAVKIAAVDARETETIRQAALAAQSSGSVKIDGADVSITGGVIIQTWNNPAITFRFRCDPAQVKPKK